MNQIEQTHTNMVNDLAKPGAEIIVSLSPHKADALHMAVGISGEAGELLEAIIHWEALAESDDHGPQYDHAVAANKENITEELGDLEFYLNRLHTNLDILRFIPDGTPNLTTMLNTVDLVIATSKVLDYVKKIVIYNKDTDKCIPNILQELATVENCLEAIRHDVGVSRDQTLEHNIHKLVGGDNARYKKGYSDEAAQKRSDKEGVE